MSHFDVYNGEMPDRALSERDVEALLSGSNPEQESLARFVLSLRSLHDIGLSYPSDQAVSKFAAAAAQMAIAARDDGEPGSPPSRQPTRGLSFSWRRGVAGGLTAAVLFSGMTGVAAAADSAAPGHFLYGLDRAMEAVGLGDGGPAERIAEARTLLDQGRVGDAIAHAAEAVETTYEGTPDRFPTQLSNAAEALRGAAERVVGGGGDNAQGLSEAVADVLGEIASVLESDEVDPTALGKQISDVARSIGASRGGEVDEGPDNEGNRPSRPDQGPPANRPGGPPEDKPSGPPSGVPGRP